MLWPFLTSESMPKSPSYLKLIIYFFSVMLDLFLMVYTLTMSLIYSSSYNLMKNHAWLARLSKFSDEIGPC